MQAAYRDEDDPHLAYRQRLVMIADDSPTIRKIVEVVLRREGYEVVAVPDGVEALRYLLMAANGEGHGPARGYLPTGEGALSGGQVSHPSTQPPLALTGVRSGRLPDLILLDIEMPRMDGYQLAVSIRKRSHLAHIPLVMISRRSGIVDRIFARLAGVRASLPRPFKEQELIALVAMIVGPAQACESAGWAGQAGR
jgi:twitching motility two-component system response regulator PilG